MQRRIFQKNSNRAGFTLIELLIIVSIIALLATAILVSVNQSRKNARINAVKTSLKTTLPVVVSCNDSGGKINLPQDSETGNKQICDLISGAFWPKLNYGYTYVSGGNYTVNCNFQIDTNGDTAQNLTCSCAKQSCQ